MFEDAGQHEPLTQRLKNILTEYKDGLTIIKELLQNADDAGATELNILYDARQHNTQKLFFPGMGNSHGPALVIHNNSKFTDEDFLNITKLAGATKKEKPRKIGKFGVGFCSVYHITDVPSFVSRNWLYIFDPTLTHLRDAVKDPSKPGKRVDFTQRYVSQTQQLDPFKHLFGFDVSKSYDETIFRLPFRKHHSEISSTMYNNSMIDELRNKISSQGTKLLLFLKQVCKVTFSKIAPREEYPQILVTIERKESALKNVGICLRTFSSSIPGPSLQEHWLIASHNEGMDLGYSTGSVACQLKVQGANPPTFELQQLSKGEVFCFLPLAVPPTGIPVDINGNFAVKSDRRGIWVDDSSDTSCVKEVEWNNVLVKQVIPHAYCKLLSGLKQLSIDGTIVDYDFYSIWPLDSMLKSQNPWKVLVHSVYELLSSESMQLFHSSSTNAWLTLDDSKFLCSNVLISQLQQEVPKCVVRAMPILKLPFVDVPHDHYRQLCQILGKRVSVIGQELFTAAFFEKIDFFSEDIDIRNEVLLCMLECLSLEEYRSN